MDLSSKSGPELPDLFTQRRGSPQLLPLWGPGCTRPCDRQSRPGPMTSAGSHSDPEWGWDRPVPTELVRSGGPEKGLMVSAAT